MKRAKGRTAAVPPAKNEPLETRARLAGIFRWAESIERRLGAIEDRLTAIETSAPMLRAAMDKIGTVKRRK